MSFTPESTINKESELCERMNRGELLLCLSNRQKKWCLQSWAKWVVAEHSGTTFEKPQVFTLHEWLWQVWGTDVAYHRADEAIRIWAWHKAFAEVSQRTLAFPVTTARRFANACEEWQVPLADKFWNHEGADVYRRWYLQSSAVLDTVKCLSDNQLVQRLIAQVPIPQEKKLVLVGLLYLNPLLEKLLCAWQHAGVKLDLWHSQAAGHQEYVLVDTGENSDAEGQVMRHVAHKAYQLSRQGERVLVVVPNLTFNWESTFDVFRREFSPHLDTHAAMLDARREFNLSGGMPLVGQPVIATALALLRLDRESSMQQIIVLLHNPIIACELSPHQRQKLCSWLWQSAASQKLHDWMNRSAAGKLPQGYENWQWIGQLYGSLASFPATAMPGEWAEMFDCHLRLCGWLQHTGQGSWDYQLLQAFTRQLSELIGLDRLGQKITCDEALHLFEQLLRGYLFQPVPYESGALLDNVPVQVLATFEATGLRFDHTLVCGMDADTLQRMQRQEYPLPAFVQQQCGMPGSSPQKILADSLTLWEGLVATAPKLWLYHAHKVNEEVVPLHPFCTATPKVESAPDSTCFAAEYAHELVESALPLQTPRVTSSSIAAQSQCGWHGWWAMARVGMEESVPVLYPSAQWRGLVIHHAFAELMRSDFAVMQKQLQQCATSKQARQQVMDWVGKAVAGAIRKYQKDAPMLSGETTALYADYLTRVVVGWLGKYELQTHPVQVEYVLEDVAIGGLVAPRLHIDRIDEYAGQAVIIDYKTGAKDVKELFEERIADPQLLMYNKGLQQQGAKVAGLGYAIVKPLGQARMKVQGSQDTDSPYRTKSFVAADQWQEMLQAAMDRLAARTALYAQGKVMLDPIRKRTRSGYEVCRYCTLKASCRVAEQIAAS